MDKPTRRMQITSRGHQIKWGTATLGAEPLVKIHVASLNAEPIHINVIHPFVLGRSDEDDPDIHVNLACYEAAQKGVSRRHATLDKINKTVMLTDLNSTNGTFLNGQRLMPGQRRIVRDDDEIRLGHLVFYIAYEKRFSEYENAQYEAIKRYAHDLE